MKYRLKFNKPDKEISKKTLSKEDNIPSFKLK